MLWAEKLVCILTCEKGNKSTSNYSCIKYFKCSFMVWTLPLTKRVIVNCFVGKNIDLQWRLGRKTHSNHKRFIKDSYFLHWNFDWKSCFVVFFLEWNEWKNPQFNFSSQNLSIEHNFFKWDGKLTKIWYLLFHRIWKNQYEPSLDSDPLLLDYSSLKLAISSSNWYLLLLIIPNLAYFEKSTSLLGFK